MPYHRHGSDRHPTCPPYRRLQVEGSECLRLGLNAVFSYRSHQLPAFPPPRASLPPFLLSLGACQMSCRSNDNLDLEMPFGTAPFPTPDIPPSVPVSACFSPIPLFSLNPPPPKIFSSNPPQPLVHLLRSLALFLHNHHLSAGVTIAGFLAVTRTYRPRRLVWQRSPAAKHPQPLVPEPSRQSTRPLKHAALRTPSGYVGRRRTTGA